MKPPPRPPLLQKLTLGIFAKTFVRPEVTDVFSAVAAHGLGSVQFNFSCCGLATLPERIDPELLDRLRAELELRLLRVAAVSATFNLIHPDESVIQSGLARLPVLAAAARTLGCRLLTLCTGTRDPSDMWRAHPENAGPGAWQTLSSGIHQALERTASWGIDLGIEPETGNIIDSARRCRRLLDEVASPRLKVVLDPANLLRPGDQRRQREIFLEAFDLLGGALGLAHAKELSLELLPDGRGAGQGILDWDYYFDQLRRAGFAGDLILHGLRETEVGAATRFLAERVQSE